MKRLFISLFAIAVVVGLVVARIASRGEQIPARGIEEIQAELGVPVDAATVRRQALEATLDLTGIVSGWRQSNLTASGDYKVEEVAVREGQEVARGQVLVRFDTRTSPDQMRLAQAREAYENALRDYRRLEPLFAEGGLSESELDAARTRFALAEADYDRARLEAEVVSPIAGTVTLVAVRPGEVVEFGDMLVQVARLDSVLVTAYVSGETSARIRRGAPVRVFHQVSAAAEAIAERLPGARADAGRPSSADPAAGRIVRVALGADPESRLYLVEALLPNPRGRYRPGQMLSFSVTTSSRDGATVMPAAAVLGHSELVEGARESVYAVVGGAAERREVVLGLVGETMVEVASGVEPGDLVVVFGANRLENGARVRLHRLDGKRAADAASPERNAASPEHNGAPPAHPSAGGSAL